MRREHSVCYKCPKRWVDSDTGETCRSGREGESPCQDYEDEVKENNKRNHKRMVDNRIRSELYDIHDSAVRKVTKE